MASPDDRFYTEEHEWARLEEDGTVTIGITDHAQEQLGDVVFVDLPEVGQDVTAGAVFGAVESVKTVSDLFAPLTGTISEVNELLLDRPELVNSDPFEEGWMVVIEPSDAAELDALLAAATYDEQVIQG